MAVAPNATSEARRIIGGVGTGKTEKLISHTAQLLESGAQPRDICVLCASPNAASAFAERMRAVVGEAIDNIAITTPRSLALGILSTDEAIAFTGREPHLVANFETSFLMEDMKEIGLRGQRLKEMLKFLYRSWTELADDDPDWLLSEEEVALHTLLKEDLGFLRAILEPELANLAVNYLRSDVGVRDLRRFKHVIVDDYELMSRASQTLAGMLAESSIVIAGSYYGSFEAYDSYPYGAGLDEFLAANPHATTEVLETSRLSAPVAAAVNALLPGECGDGGASALPLAEADNGRIRVLKHTTSADEFSGIASLVKDELAAGDLRPSDIFVAVPNRAWSESIAAHLEQLGLKSSRIGGGDVLNGNITDNSRCVASRIYTALKLVADPSNAISWRCWCGFGDDLANSFAFGKLRGLSRENGTGLVDILRELASDTNGDHLGLEKITSAYSAGESLIAAAEGLTGADLLEFLARRVTGDDAAEIPSGLLDLCAPIGKVEAAKDLCERVERRLFSPLFADDRDAVRVGSLESLCGLTPRLLIFSGFVNGFIPCRDYFDATKVSIDKQEKMRVRDMRLLYAALGKAQGDLVLSYFTRIDIESAERSRVQIDRIRLEKGERMCVVSPSDYLETILEHAAAVPERLPS